MAESSLESPSSTNSDIYSEISPPANATVGKRSTTLETPLVASTTQSTEKTKVKITEKVSGSKITNPSETSSTASGNASIDASTTVTTEPVTGRGTEKTSEGGSSNMTSVTERTVGLSVKTTVKPRGAGGNVVADFIPVSLFA